MNSSGSSVPGIVPDHPHIYSTDDNVDFTAIATKLLHIVAYTTKRLLSVLNK